MKNNFKSIKRLLQTQRKLINRLDQLVGKEKQIMRRYLNQLELKILRHPDYKTYIEELFKNKK